MTDTPDPFTNMYEGPAKLMRAMFAPMMGTMDAAKGIDGAVSPEDAKHWAEVGAKLQAMWLQSEGG